MQIILIFSSVLIPCFCFCFFLKVTLKHLKGGKETKMDVLVMENLLYRRNIRRLYDLKGSSRSRYNPDTSGSNKVLLDQNLIEAMPTSPIFVGNKAKRLLERAVWNDTAFLAVSLIAFLIFMLLPCRFEVYLYGFSCSFLLSSSFPFFALIVMLERSICTRFIGTPSLYIFLLSSESKRIATTGLASIYVGVYLVGA